MSDPTGRLPPCSACGNPAIVMVSAGGACAGCLQRACRASIANEEAWFGAPPQFVRDAVPAAEDARTHSDLALAYADMGLERDALNEGALAVAADARHAEQHGERILGGLSPLGWRLLRRLGALH